MKVKLGNIKFSSRLFNCIYQFSGNIIPDQEYLLQGSLLDSHIEVFKHRLRGLCDNSGGEEQFCEREMVFSIRGTSAQPLSLRVRKTETLGERQ